MPKTISHILDDIINYEVNSIALHKPKRNIKFPHTICFYSVNSNHKAILCHSCDKWTRISCSDTSNEEYELLQNDSENRFPWNCINCKIRFNLHNIPFTLCDSEEM